MSTKDEEIIEHISIEMKAVNESNDSKESKSNSVPNKPAASIDKKSRR